MEKRQFVEKETILERNTYLPGSRKTTVVSFHQHPLPPPPPHTPVKEQGEKQYSCKVCGLMIYRVFHLIGKLGWFNSDM